MNTQKAFFFDRDGVINVDHGYVAKKTDFEFIEGLFPVMRALSALGYLLIIVTNQSGVGRGYYTEQDFDELNEWMLERFAGEQIDIRAVYKCLHAPEAACSCRKPAPGMLLQAISDYDLDPALCWMIGDKVSDLAAAQAAGIPGRILFGSAACEQCTHVVSTYAELAKVLNLPCEIKPKGSSSGADESL